MCGPCFCLEVAVASGREADSVFGWVSVGSGAFVDLEGAGLGVSSCLRMSIISLAGLFSNLAASKVISLYVIAGGFGFSDLAGRCDMGFSMDGMGMP